MPIPGTTKIARVTENIDAAEPDLTTDEIAEINTAAANGEGTRYTAVVEAYTGL